MGDTALAPFASWRVVLFWRKFGGESCRMMKNHSQNVTRKTRTGRLRYVGWQSRRWKRPRGPNRLPEKPKVLSARSRKLPSNCDSSRNKHREPSRPPRTPQNTLIGPEQRPSVRPTKPERRTPRPSAQRAWLNKRKARLQTLHNGPKPPRQLPSTLRNEPGVAMEKAVDAQKSAKDAEEILERGAADA